MLFARTAGVLCLGAWLSLCYFRLPAVASFLLLQVPCCCRSPAVAGALLFALDLAIDPNVTCVLVV
jgi:hypothetical protein